MLGKINSHICLMFTKRFYQNQVKYGAKKMKYYKTELGLKFKFLWRQVKPKAGLKPVSITEIRFAKERPVLTSL